jgi:uncharacterized integral membrane protein
MIPDKDFNWRRFYMQVFLVISLIIALVAVIFAVQNTALVTVTFLVWNLENSLAVVLLVAVFAGVLISIFASLPGWIRNRVGKSGQKKKVKELETELARLNEKYQAAQQELELYHASEAPQLESEPTALSGPESLNPPNSLI